ncbi:ParM/StbA family protein [Bacillus salipaludis]|uniref:ParM/StbA family protein n=1 Tax=Bacillus salipaludis TaxID=2547811 RepID=UPI002E1E017D|nr:ParM/StbA family protein [Bacillus salipaludis]
MAEKAGVFSCDNGGHSTCIVTAKSFSQFPSVKGEFRERSLVNPSGTHDYIVEFKGRRYMAGTLAQTESRFPMQMHSRSKQHLFFDLSIMISLHQFGYDKNYLITSVPISMHHEEEKEGIRKRLVGEWSIIVNGIERTFTIEDVKVAPETVSAFWIHEPEGKTRFLDIGSRTVGYGTTLKEGSVMKYIDSESGTFMGKGLEATETTNYEEFADFIAGKLLAQWDENDKVYLLGGGAKNKLIVNQLKKYFKKTEVMENAQLANAKGMYLLGRNVYGRA